MASSSVTFGQLLGLLNELGFSTDEIRQIPEVRVPIRVCRHATTNAVLFYRERPLSEAAREHELLSTRTHLGYGGFLTPEAFDQFVESIENSPKSRSRATK